MNARETVSCTKTTILTSDGREIERNSTYFDNNERCHDCGIVNEKGNVHHLGCDMERCPLCKSQMLGCGCWADEETDELDEIRHAIVQDIDGFLSDIGYKNILTAFSLFVDMLDECARSQDPHHYKALDELYRQLVKSIKR
jgi:hypothetical protein